MQFNILFLLYNDKKIYLIILKNPPFLLDSLHLILYNRLVIFLRGYLFTLYINKVHSKGGVPT